MLRLPRHDYFKLTGWNPSSYKTAVRRSELAMAFGTDRLLAGGICIDLDVLAEEFVRELSPHFTRKFAATVVIAFSDQWAEAVSRAEAGHQLVFLIVGQYGEPAPRRGSADRLQINGEKDFGVNVGVWDPSSEQTPFDPSKHRNLPDRIVLINVKKLLTRVRERAMKFGIDLSQRFCPAPSDPAFLAECRQFKEWRERTVDRQKIAVSGER